ncbi:MAG: hypothetical protein MJZ16_09750 [Bacteroidales bacterium]|nr:hypothetical protein [Bacteroidales bacterium]
MKKVAVLIVVIISFICSGCTKESALERSLVGKWAMTGFHNGYFLTDNSKSVPIIFKLYSDGTFEQINSHEYRGFFTFTDGTLTIPCNTTPHVSKWHMEGHDLCVDSYYVPVGTVEKVSSKKIITHNGAWGGSDGYCVFEKVKKTVL